MKIKLVGSNQTEVHIGLAIVFHSYETPVAIDTGKGGIFRTAEKFSRTTSKHINQWLDGRSATELPKDHFETLVESYTNG